MNYKGRNIDPLALWANYVDEEIEISPHSAFSSLCFCPNPDHDNTRSPAFQINVYKPMVHCFSGCGISGGYDHAISVIEGFYDECGVSQKDITLAKTKRKKDEPPEVRAARARVFKAKRKAEKIILELGLKKGGGASVKLSSRKIQERKLSLNRAERVDGDGIIDRKTLLDYSYLTKEAIAYLNSRGIDDSSRSRWQIGFDEKEERITIPVFDDRDRLRFIIKRSIKHNSRMKYLNPPESLAKSLLFGTRHLDKNMVDSEGLIVVEGPLDCIRLHQHGFANTIAILGSTLSEKQRTLIGQLRPSRIYLFLDRDAAGIQGLQKAAAVLTKYQIKVPRYPKHSFDPATLTDTECRRAIERAIPLLTLKQKMAEAQLIH